MFFEASVFAHQLWPYYFYNLILIIVMLINSFHCSLANFFKIFYKNHCK